MGLLSCLFGKGTRRERFEKPNEAATAPTSAQSQAQSQSQSQETKTSCASAAFPEARRNSVNKIPPTEISITSNSYLRNENPADSAGGSPVAARGPASLATQLLSGLTFSTRILGIGSYGLVLHGSFDGADVAVKFMVSSRRADRAAVQEITLGGLSALTHPHVCKVYDTRSAVITDALFDELEAHRTRLRQRQERQRQRLQQQVAAGPAVAAVGDGGPKPLAPQPLAEYEAQTGSRASSHAAPCLEQRSNERLRNLNGERLLRFRSDDDNEPFGVHPHPDQLRPLESSVPYTVLHEVLYRLGAVVGQSVTLVVMEHCAKGNLSRAIHRGIFEPCEMWGTHVARRALVRTAAEIARALLHLHKTGVVHGDIKPGNILLASSRSDRRGFVAKIGDFGLSHLLPDGATSVDTNTWGTPSYMAPEALMGHASPASDVWSFGVMMSEALTRQRPYGDILEPANLVVGILDGSLHLKWPEVRLDLDAHGGSGVDADGESGAGAGAGGLGTAARLARQYGLVFPATKSARSIAAAAAAANANAATVGSGGPAAAVPSVSLMGTSTSLECGTGTCTGTTITSVTSAAGTIMLSTINGADDSVGTAVTAAVTATAAAAAVRDDDQERVLSCLVGLGRRCTDRDPARRPCFSEILGELIDMEIILKTSRPNRAASGLPSTGTAAAAATAREEHDLGARARSRLAIAAAATAAATTAATTAATAASGSSTGKRVGNDRGRSAAVLPPLQGGPRPAVDSCSAAIDPGQVGGLVRTAPAAPAAAVAATTAPATERRRPVTALELMQDFLRDLAHYQDAFTAGTALEVDPALRADAVVLTATPTAGGGVRLRAATPRPSAAAQAALAAAPAAGLIRAGDRGEEIVVLMPLRRPPARLELPLPLPLPPSPPRPAAASPLVPFLVSVPLAAVEPAEAGHEEVGHSGGGGGGVDIEESSVRRHVGEVQVFAQQQEETEEEAVAAVEPPPAAAAAAAAAVATGPGPATPDVSECCCCVESKSYQEPLA